MKGEFPSRVYPDAGEGGGSPPPPTPRIGFLQSPQMSDIIVPALTKLEDTGMTRTKEI